MPVLLEVSFSEMVESAIFLELASWPVLIRPAGCFKLSPIIRSGGFQRDKISLSISWGQDDEGVDADDGAEGDI